MKLFALAAAMACITLPAISMADVEDIQAANNEIGIHRISTNVDYTETSNNLLNTGFGTLDTETGSVLGYDLSFSRMLRNAVYLQAEYSQNSGQTDYIGAWQGGVYGTVGTRDGARLTDFHFRVGKGFATTGNSMITPYAEVGSHQWDRSPIGIFERYTHKYVGAGVLGQYSPATGLVFSLRGMLARTEHSHIAINLPLGAQLGNSWLTQVGLSADYAFYRNWHGTLGLDYTRFKYGISNPQSVPGLGTVWEPDSSTKYRTVSVGVAYSF